MFGGQTGHATLQNAAHGIEGTEDHDSISGVGRGDGCAQGLQRAGVLPGDLTEGTRTRAGDRGQRLRQIGRRAGAGQWQVAQMPVVDEWRDAGEHGTQ